MEEKLKDILEKLNAAYDLTELVPANGQNLDRLAMARQEMRDIGQSLKSILAGASKGDAHG